MRIRVPVVVACIALAPALAVAQPDGGAPEPAARVLGRLLAGDNLETLQAQFQEAMRPLMKATVEGQLARALTADEERGVLEAFRRAFQQVFPRTLIEGEMANVLALDFSEAELAEMLAFYQSPTGRKVLALQGTVFQEGQQVFRSRQREFTEHLLGELTREVRPRR